jgi:iron only hydrogenase large subunit-like protein
MSSFASLYNSLLKAGIDGRLDEKIEEISSSVDFDKHQLDCLLNPKKYPPVVKISKCDCTSEQADACIKICEFDAIEKTADGDIDISMGKCVGCGDCIEKCAKQNLVEIKEFIPIVKLLKSTETPIFAMIAPAYISQFSDDISPGKLRSAFKQLGFEGMIEVALFADILTLKEALEFDRTIKNDNDFMLTSCCCPMWIAMIKKVYHDLVPHLPPSVSPMVACARSIKKLHPKAKTVFIGPCIAKKAESRAADISDAVDFVLTFEEMKKIFDVAKIDPEQLQEDLRDHSSMAGRTYARTGGVSEAVKNTVDRLNPQREIPLKFRLADGVPACKLMLKDIMSGDIKANFIEGMGCVGGCVGGPKALIDMDKATVHVNEYGQKATYETPIDNPYVIELLKRVGFDTIESLLENDNIFIRDFNK